MRNSSLWSDVVFEKEVIFHEFDFETSRLEFEVSKSSIWKHTTSCDKGVFFFHSYLATPTTNWAQIFTGLLFYAYVERYTKWEDWSLTIINSVAGDRFKDNALSLNLSPALKYWWTQVFIYKIHRNLWMNQCLDCTSGRSPKFGKISLSVLQIKFKNNVWTFLIKNIFRQLEILLYK